MEIVDLIIRIDCFRVSKEAVEVGMRFLECRRAGGEMEFGLDRVGEDGLSEAEVRWFAG